MPRPTIRDIVGYHLKRELVKILDWIDEQVQPATAAVWGGITGVIGDQADLAALLAGKAALSHSHPASQISDGTAAGRALLTAADESAQRAVLNVEDGAAAERWSYVSLVSDNTVSTTANADVTGMSFTALADTTYEVEVFGAFSTNATTTGIGLSLDIPSGSVIGMTLASSSNTAVLATQTRADDATLAPTTGVASANANFPLWGKYLVAVGNTGGAVQLRQRSEVAGSNTVLVAGLRMKWRAI